MKKLILLLSITSVMFGCKTSKPVVNKTNYNRFEKNICRGNGEVVVIDSTQTAIRVKGIVIKNDSIITQYRYILAFGSFNRQLQKFNGKHILFECEGMIPNRFYGEDILPTIKGCVENNEPAYTSM